MKCPKCGAKINIGKLIGSQKKKYSEEEIAKRTERLKAAQAKRVEEMRKKKEEL